MLKKGTCIAVMNSLKPRNPCRLESAIAQTFNKHKEYKFKTTRTLIVRQRGGKEIDPIIKIQQPPNKIKNHRLISFPHRVNRTIIECAFCNSYRIMEIQAKSDYQMLKKRDNHLLPVSLSVKNLNSFNF